MKKYIIYEDELQQLINSDMMLTALEIGGVDNWIGYSYAANNFIEDNKTNYPEFTAIDPENITYDDMARAEIKANWSDRELK